MKRLRYRPIASSSSCCAYARWLRALRDPERHGVYVIRSRSGIVVYVGESHTGRLYGTLTRHFQSWSGLTAGTTYSLLGGYEAAVIVTKTPRAAVRLQEALIRRLEPRDNTHHAGGDDAEDVDLGSAEDDFAEGPDPFDF